MTVAEVIKGSKVTRFQSYRNGNLYYKTDSGFEFVVPQHETGGATFLAEDKTIFFMRWIRQMLNPDQTQHIEHAKLQSVAYWSGAETLATS